MVVAHVTLVQARCGQEVNIKAANGSGLPPDQLFLLLHLASSKTGDVGLILPPQVALTVSPSRIPILVMGNGFNTHVHMLDTMSVSLFDLEDPTLTQTSNAFTSLSKK